MKKVLSFLGASMLCAACAAFTAYAEIGAAALNDGVYNIDVESDSSMFKVVNCDITVNGGKLTAAVTLSGTGYGKLFIGTGEQAASAAESEFIPFTEDAEGRYVYTFGLSALDEEIEVAAWSTKKGEWYDRKLIFKSDKLPESAHNAANGGLISQPDMTDWSNQNDKNEQNNQQNSSNQTEQSDKSENQANENPNTGSGGLMLLPAVLIAVDVVCARKISGKKSDE